MKYAPPIGQEAQGEDAHYIDGNPELGILGSPVPAAALEPVQRELVHVIRKAGLEPSAEDLTQLYQAFCKIIRHEAPFATCKTAGNVAAKTVTIEGLELYAGASLKLVFTDVNTAGDITLALNGGEPKPVLTTEGGSPEVGELAKGQIYTLVYSGTSWQILAGMARTRICQIEWFEDALSRPGFVPLNGGVVENFAASWPQAMAYLQTAHGRARCFASLDERTAAHVATWHTLASGAKVGWEGVGGLARFYHDAAEDKLYLPDFRGMFRCMAGDGVIAPSLGGAMGDRARAVTGELNGSGSDAISQFLGDSYYSSVGAIYISRWHRTYGVIESSVLDNYPWGLALDSARVTPTGAANVPRSWGALACCYLGRPATVQTAG